MDSDTPSLPSSATDPSNTVQFQLLQRYVTEDWVKSKNHFESKFSMKVKKGDVKQLQRMPCQKVGCSLCQKIIYQFQPFGPILVEEQKKFVQVK